MSRIDEMVRQLCPDGVEYQPVKSLFSIISAPRKIPRSEYGNGSTYPIIDQGQSAIAGYTDDESALVPNGEYILFGDHTRAVKWADYPFAQGADGLKILVPIDALIPRFAYHVIQGLTIPSRGYNRHWTVLNQIEIPVPPLDIQREIVQVLDSFAELEEELEAELEARKAQYAHYRDELLSRESLEEMAGEPVSSLSVKDSVKVIAAPKKIARSDFNLGSLYPIIDQGQDAIAGFTDDEDALVPDGHYVLFGDHTREVKWADFPFAQGADGLKILKAKDNFLPRFVYHAISNLEIPSRGYNRHWTVLNNLEIPVPPLSVQQQVVDILDRFNALTTSLIDGLPAEIEARRQQYEYYRDKLLDFPRKGAAA